MNFNFLIKKKSISKKTIQIFGNKIYFNNIKG